MILTIGTATGIEDCKPCEGSGWLGTCGKYNLQCESCNGFGFVWVDYGCI